jgi:hypothetical protein
MALPGLLAVAGCADSAFTANVADEGSATGGEVATRFLRLDVYPSEWQWEEAGLLPETFIFEGEDWTSLDLEMSTPVQLSGTLSGFDASARADVSVPGYAHAIPGRFVARVPDTVMERQVETEDGEMSLTVVPGGDYVLAWVPSPEYALPFLIQSDISLRGAVDISQDLDYGVPLYGVVTDEDGQPLSDIVVQAVDPGLNLAGSPSTTDANGSFLVRVYPGSYTLRASGDAVRFYLPTLSIPVDVGEEGLQQDISYGATEAHSVTGLVFDKDDSPLANVRVRVTAQALNEDDEAALVVESETDRNGAFTVRVVSGTYAVEYIPEFDGEIDDDDNAGPLAVAELLTVTDDMELDQVNLPQRPVVEGRVLTPSGEPVEDVVIIAQEQGFDGVIYTTSSDDNGVFVLTVADTTLTWTLLPPPDLPLAVTLLEASPRDLEDDDFTLVQGEMIGGCVDYQGEPLAYTPVDIRDGDARLYTTTLTDSAGCFEMRLDTESWATEGEDTGGDGGGEDTGGDGDTGDTGQTDTGGDTAGGDSASDSAAGDTAGEDTAGEDTAAGDSGADTGGGDTPGSDEGSADTGGVDTDSAG